MKQETVQALSGVNIITESGTKIPLGNREFSVGETVWTDGQYVFGNNRKSVNLVQQEGPGIIGDYFIVPRHGVWCVFNAGSLTKMEIDDTCNLQSNYIFFHNSTGTKMAAFTGQQYVFVSGDSATYNYKELELNKGITSKTITFSGIVPSGSYVGLYLIDCYYDEQDRATFVFITDSVTGYAQIVKKGSGGTIIENFTDTPYKVFTYADGELVKTEEIATEADSLTRQAAADMATLFDNTELTISNTIMVTDSMVQQYWDNLGDDNTHYLVSKWDRKWHDSVVIDKDNSTYDAFYNGSNTKLNYSKNSFCVRVSYGININIAWDGGDGYGAIVRDIDYANTIGLRGFDDGSLDNYYVLSNIAGTGTNKYIAYYGPNVTVPSQAPTGYHLISKWSHNGLFLTDYSAVKNHVGGDSTYDYQEAGELGNHYLSTNTGSTNGFSGDSERLYLMRIEKYTYTLTKTVGSGINAVTTTYEKTAYSTCTVNTVSIEPQEKIAEPQMTFNQEYHSGWKITYTKDDTSLIASKNGESYTLPEAISNNYWCINNYPTLFSTENYVMYFNREKNTLVKIDKKTKEQTDFLTDVYRFMSYSMVLWRIPLANLILLFGQKSST